MKELTLFECLHIEDPLVEKLKTIKTNETAVIGPFTVLRNEVGLYEVTTEEIHECARTVMEVVTIIQEHSKDLN
ncbi:hypothetical protein [Bacillus alkalicellulosilyticus]|uniref:hypothetical protein n=1 Tax=Alkalihalobacterium alkalicellulosilyticum TaxID=1912214 RepID=UPI0009981881|nr:hypothetical protein [Bacillus alkalicellulosilyticus]